MCDLADLYDEESGLMDLDNLTKSEMSLDQLRRFPISSAELSSVCGDISSNELLLSECPVERKKC